MNLSGQEVDLVWSDLNCPVSRHIRLLAYKDLIYYQTLKTDLENLGDWCDQFAINNIPITDNLRKVNVSTLYPAFFDIDG